MFVSLFFCLLTSLTFFTPHSLKPLILLSFSGVIFFSLSFYLPCPFLLFYLIFLFLSLHGRTEAELYIRVTQAWMPKPLTDFQKNRACSVIWKITSGHSGHDLTSTSNLELISGWGGSQITGCHFFSLETQAKTWRAAPSANLGRGRDLRLTTSLSHAPLLRKKLN